MDFVLAKIFVSYGTIKKISKHFDQKTLLVLYNSLIVSHIRYCITTCVDQSDRNCRQVVTSA